MTIQNLPSYAEIQIKGKEAYIKYINLSYLQYNQ